MYIIFIDMWGIIKIIYGKTFVLLKIYQNQFSKQKFLFSKYRK